MAAGGDGKRSDPYGFSFGRKEERLERGGGEVLKMAWFSLGSRSVAAFSLALF
jgi:hypothetical protein